MNLSTLDWGIIIAFFAVTLFIGLYASRGAGKSYSEFFLSGRDMSWWLLGVSMVATTFSADTPNLVTDLVRTHGVAGNWSWWAFLLTGMLTVFVYARLWRRSGVLTDLEFYELRYSGKPAAFLRGFRAIYLGVFFNVMIMATVSLAAIKIGAVMLDLKPVETLLITSIITVIYTSIGGLKGVVLTDFFQFVLAMIGMVVAAIYIVNLPEVGGLSNMLAHPNVSGKLNFLPDFSDSKQLIPLFLMPLAVQWWSVWYPGAEPGGGGYIAQRMLSAKDEKNAVTATLFFNIAHYALRPWPWILIALASLIVFPDIASLQAAFPHIDPKVVKNDLAFSAMLNLLPAGLIGLLIAALLSAFMSTISTHLNWGSSYIVNDFYKRFIRPDAPQNELVNIGRLSTVVLMILAALLA
ncbi:MAG: Na+:solute symporter, partial [Bacteroidetes bacterium]|nr:Na+:solute symporter [Bacteroidota bacterium]